MLPANRTALFMCDLQTKFKGAMHHWPEIINNAKKLVDSCKILGVPLIVTEQYPKGLGPTVEELDVSHAAGVFAKTRFSMVVPEVEKTMEQLCDGQLQCAVLFGVEAHVCVEQTAIELRSRGIQVHVVADASTSREQEDRLLAFERMKQMGCFVTTSENVIFKLVGDKDHPKFNEIRPFLKDTSNKTGLVARM